jgi:hypothetical protein
MKRELIRIGTNQYVNESVLYQNGGFDALFNRDNYYEFVYVPNFGPWDRVNGTWQGALGYLMNDSSERD